MPELMNDTAMLDKEQMDRRGWQLFPQIVQGDALEKLRGEFELMLARRAADMQRNGILEKTAGTAHHLLERDNYFMHWLQQLLLSPAYLCLNELLGGATVLNSFGGVDNRPGQERYVSSVHRDVRTYTSDVRLMMQLLVMLDDFTVDNGATWMLSGSHLSAQKPSDEEFFRQAEQVSGRAGQVLLFDSRCWHAAGANMTQFRRRALTLTLTRPFVKPQIDHCRLLGYDYCATLPEPLQQLLGYFARIPASIDEWYQPPESRYYRSSQG